MIVKVSRRQFLVAAGGTSLVLPMLEALSTPKALAAYEEVRRVIFYLTSCGTPKIGRPTGVGSAFQLGAVHAGLSKHQADVLYVAGLDSKAAVLSAGNPHGVGVASTLSGRKCLAGDTFLHEACFGIPEGCAGTGWGDGPSLDYDLGHQLLFAKVPVVVGMLPISVRNCPETLNTRWSYSAPRTPVPPYVDPQVAFDAIFGKPSDKDPTSAARAARRRTTILDALQSDIAELERKVSSSDRMRLDQHLTAIRELEASVKSLAARPESGSCAPPARPTLKAGPMITRNVGGMEVNFKDDDGADLPARHEVWRKMSITALACDLTRVVTFGAEPGRSDTFMPFLATDPDYDGMFSKSHHSASHDNDENTLIAMDHWYAKQISAWVDDLKSTAGADGKPLFENSAVAWLNELSLGSHFHVDKPHTLVGSLGGYFKTGQLVQYPTGTPHNVLLTAIAQAMGMTTEHYGGTEPELQGGDLSLLKA